MAATGSEKKLPQLNFILDVPEETLNLSLVYDIQPYDKSSVLVSGEKGLLILSTKGKVLERVQLPEGTEDVTDAVVTKSGLLCVCSSNKILIRFNGKWSELLSDQLGCANALALSADEGTLSVLESCSHKIIQINLCKPPSFEVIKTIQLDDIAKWECPMNLTCEPDGSMMLSDGGDVVRVIAPNGRDITLEVGTYGKPGKGEGEFDGPCGFWKDSLGRIIVGEMGNNRLTLLSPDGTHVAHLLQSEESVHELSNGYITEDGHLVLAVGSEACTDSVRIYKYIV